MLQQQARQVKDITPTSLSENIVVPAVPNRGDILQHCNQPTIARFQSSASLLQRKLTINAVKLGKVVGGKRSTHSALQRSLF
jgi:hypothetical protein